MLRRPAALCGSAAEGVLDAPGDLLPGAPVGPGFSQEPRPLWGVALAALLGSGPQHQTLNSL